MNDYIKRQDGYWIKVNTERLNSWKCNICGEKVVFSLMGMPRFNYCPMCGAKMEEANDHNG